MYMQWERFIWLGPGARAQNTWAEKPEAGFLANVSQSSGAAEMGLRNGDEGCCMLCGIRESVSGREESSVM